MPEVVRPLDGVPVMLRPCPPWCTEGRHFADGEAIYADHGYDHSRTQPNETATASALKLTGLTLPSGLRCQGGGGGDREGRQRQAHSAAAAECGWENRVQ